MTGDSKSRITLPRKLDTLAHHDESRLPPAYGPRVVHLHEGMADGADLFITSRSVVRLEAPAEPNVSPHRHDVSQTFLFTSDDGSLEFEIEIDGRHETGRAPAAVFVPAGAMHSLRILRGTGTVFSILRSGQYG